MRLVPAITLCALIAASMPVAAAQNGPVSLARQGGWEINYDTDACHIFGRFGQGKDETILGITRYEPGNGFDMGLIGKPLQSRDPQTAIELGYGDLSPAWENGMAGQAGKTNLPMLTVTSQRLDGWHWSKKQETPPAVTPAQEAAVRAITFRLKGGKRYRLETGSMAKPMEAMRACLADLMVSWGFDPAVQASLSRPLTPLSNPVMWFRTNDFPINAAMLGHNGLVQVRMDVDADGKMAGCHVLRRTNPDEFADLTCEILAKRARFSPALDVNGKPVKSFYMFKLHWVTTNY
jgi:hypothetical protein